MLELADKLARMERTRPKQVSLRRSVSTAYYALFHLLTSDSIAILAPNVTSAASGRLQRWFDHGEMKKVAGMFSSPTLQKQFATLVQAPPSLDLQTVALNFVSLQQARHEADYDMNLQLDRSAVLDYLQSAWDAFEAWNRICRSHEANVFALALLSPKLFDRER